MLLLEDNSNHSTYCYFHCEKSRKSITTNKNDEMNIWKKRWKIGAVSLIVKRKKPDSQFSRVVMEYLGSKWDWWKDFTCWDCNPAPSLPFLNSLYRTGPHSPVQHPWTSCCSWNSPSSLWPLHSFFPLPSGQQFSPDHPVDDFASIFKPLSNASPLERSESCLWKQPFTGKLHHSNLQSV